MILQSTDALEEYIGNKYSLVIVAAKRARQLKEGHPQLVRDSSDNKLSLALREIEEERLQAIAPPEEEIAPAPRDVIASLAGADFDLDEDMDLEDSDAVDDLAALLVGADDEEEEEADADADAETDADGSIPAADGDEEEADADEDEADESEDTDETIDDTEEDDEE